VVGALGPALAPAGNTYAASEIRIDVEDLPPGYDIGTSQYTTVPSQAAGYSLTVGSDASRTLLGIALGPGGQPLGLLGGLLQLLDKDVAAEPVLLFTNRAGRFAGNGLGPGRYEIILGTEHKFRAEVSIPTKSRGTVDVGNLQFTEVLP
jgi:outer membrane usher protein